MGYRLNFPADQKWSRTTATVAPAIQRKLCYPINERRHQK